jgi:hypothetical protein
MSTGHRIKVKGFKRDKSGTRIVRDLKGLDVSTRLKKQGKQKLTYGRKR